MNQNTPTKYNNSYDEIKKQVKTKTPEAIIKLIATQNDRLLEAKRRIEEEGLVVRDIKGSVIPHPAIKIEQDCTKILHDLLRIHRR